MGVQGSDMHAAEQPAAVSLLSAFKTIDAAGKSKHAGVLDYWHSIRGDRDFPPLHDLDPLAISDAGPGSALLELIGGGEDAEIRHLGETLKTDAAVERIIDSPRPSILSSIAGKLPIVAISRNFLTFEDEFSAAGATTRCWVTLLPLSSAGAWVDYVYAFVTFETVPADAEVVDDGSDEGVPELLLESVEPPEIVPNDVEETTAIPPIDSEEAESVTEDVEQSAEAAASEPAAPEPETVADSAAAIEQSPDFSELAHDPATADGYYGEPTVRAAPPRPPVPLANGKVADPTVAAEPAGTTDGLLQDRLAAVRAKADAARIAKLASNAALYEGLSAAYDFALDAEDCPEEYLKLVEAQGLKIQLRSPMLPVMKLAFAGMCDEPTIARLEAVLAWALEQELPRGALAERIEAAGGIARILSGEDATP